MSTDTSMMGFKSLSQKLQYDFPDAPVPMIDDAIVEAARKLCERPILEVWCDLTPELQPGEDIYEFDHHLPESLEMAAITAVEYCGCCIDPVDSKCEPCQIGWSLCDDESIRIHPGIGAEVGEQTLRLCLSLRPCVDACTLPKQMKRYTEALKEYARAFMYNAPNQSWTNPRLHNHHRTVARALANRIHRKHSNNHAASGISKARKRRWVI